MANADFKIKSGRCGIKAGCHTKDQHFIPHARLWDSAIGTRDPVGAGIYLMLLV